MGVNRGPAGGLALWDGGPRGAKLAMPKACRGGGCTFTEWGIYLIVTSANPWENFCTYVEGAERREFDEDFEVITGIFCNP